MRAFVAVCLVCPLLASFPAAADPLDRGAAWLVARQGSWQAGEGRVVAEGWEWRPGSGNGAANVSGIVGLALWELGEKRSDSAHLEAARRRAGIVRKVLGGGGTCFAPDLELLARVAKAEGDGEAVDLVARAIEARVAAAGGPAGEVRRLAAWRGDLAGYDVAQLAEAALAADRGALARALLAEAETQAWRRDPRSTFGVISSGALLSAELAAGATEAAAGEAAFLLGLQAKNGSWHAHETEATAYAVRGLAAYARATRSAAAREAARAGRSWLEHTQLSSGAWADYHDGLAEPFVGEVFSSASAEALRALVSAD